MSDPGIDRGQAGDVTPEAARAEPSNADIARMLGLLAHRIDQQTASFAALAGILAAMPEARGCETRLAMAAAANMVEPGEGNDEVRKAAAANVLAIIAAGHAIDAKVREAGQAAAGAATPAAKSATP
jgi:hypothetical protein